MSTYLELVQDLHRDCNVGGTSPTSASFATGLTGVASRLKAWVKDSDIEIKSKWFNWKFLWADSSITTVNGTSTYSAPTGLGIYDKETFLIGTDALAVVEYREFKETLRGTTVSNAKPTLAVILPDNRIRLWPTPDAVYTVTYEYYKSAVASTLAVHGDESVIPTAFHKVLYYSAMLKYANWDNAGELRQQAMEQLYGLDQSREGGWIAKLEAHQLPNHGYANAVSDANYEIQVVAE